MIQVDVKEDPNQSIQVPFRDGIATIDMYYSALNSSWFMNISYGERTVNNILVEQGVNLAYPFRHMFPFGLLCISDSGLRPLFIDSFSTQESVLILLQGDENTDL